MFIDFTKFLHLLLCDVKMSRPEEEVEKNDCESFATLSNFYQLLSFSVFNFYKIVGLYKQDNKGSMSMFDTTGSKFSKKWQRKGPVLCHFFCWSFIRKIILYRFFFANSCPQLSKTLKIKKIRQNIKIMWLVKIGMWWEFVFTLRILVLFIHVWIKYMLSTITLFLATRHTYM